MVQGYLFLYYRHKLVFQIFLRKSTLHTSESYQNLLKSIIQTAPSNKAVLSDLISCLFLGNLNPERLEYKYW